MPKKASKPKRKSSHGGARPGAGRKPTPAELRIVTYAVTVRLTEEARANLDAATVKFGITQSEAISRGLAMLVGE